MQDFIRSIDRLGHCVDLAAGSGRDLGIVKMIHPRAHLTAMEAGHEYAARLVDKADDVEVANIERDIFPFADDSIDLS